MGRCSPGHPAKVFGISFLFSLISAFAFASWLDAVPSLEAALKAGAITGFGFVAASLGINYQFAQRSFKVWLIDGGNHTTQFILYGLVLGLLAWGSPPAALSRKLPL